MCRASFALTFVDRAVTDEPRRPRKETLRFARQTLV
jgi:hypothetical protein